MSPVYMSVLELEVPKKTYQDTIYNLPQKMMLWYSTFFAMISVVKKAQMVYVKIN